MSIWLIILLTLTFSAFFSGMEIAFLSANRMHIELESKKGTFPFRILSYLSRNPGRFIAAMLVGNNVALVIYGLFMPDIVEPYLQWAGNKYLILLLTTLVGTLVILFVAEFIPKAIFNTRANELIKIFALPASLFYAIFYPIVGFVTFLSNLVIRGIFKAEMPRDQPVFGKIDLDNYIAEQTSRASSEEDVDPEIEIFQNALEFAETKVREFMIPRTEIMAVPVDEPIEKLKERFIEHGYSKILIYEENIDHIIGYVHAYELFKRPADIRSILRPLLFIPESMNANEVLNHLIRDKRSIAVIIDEFGGTSGLVTLEDVVEEIFGEIDDEHDTEDHVEQVLSESEFVFSGRLEIDYLNSKYDLELPESDNYSTLGGLIFERTETIPEKGTRIRVEDYVLVIKKVSSNRIEEVRVLVNNND
ncbi:MAG: hemolysin family protein [Bacteroidota bacterium]|nr:hemolysin family protein [Bacteroidota bacterium]